MEVLRAWVQICSKFSIPPKVQQHVQVQRRRCNKVGGGGTKRVHSAVRDGGVRDGGAE